MLISYCCLTQFLSEFSHSQNFLQVEFVSFFFNLKPAQTHFNYIFLLTFFFFLLHCLPSLHPGMPNLMEENVHKGSIKKILTY